MLVTLLVGVWLPLSVPALQFEASKIRQTAVARFGARAGTAIDQWMANLESARGLSERRQLDVVNDFWNMTAMAGEDIHIWGQLDYWATPVETLGKGAADCEDFVIGKYFSLLHLGVPNEKLRLIYVRAQVGGQSIAHMVLGYYPTPQSEPLLLDNLSGSIRPASQRPDLTPVFSFNSQGVYVGNAQKGSVDSISRWRGLLDKMRKEGFVP
ncbi:transglutaminase-like cysteine peptidase [Alcaligenes sp. CHO6]|uniref:transglutaminase-like cysteine peptidase n=1 Tax=Alcaligenes sp. CHO6 TaxID=3123298 RepID=UPI0007503410